MVFTFSDDCLTAISLACPKRRSTTHLHTRSETAASCFALKSSLSCHLCPKFCWICGLHTISSNPRSLRSTFTSHTVGTTYYIGSSRCPERNFLPVPQGFPWRRASGAPASNRLAGAGPDGELKGTPSNETEEELKGLVVETRRREYGEKNWH